MRGFLSTTPIIHFMGDLHTHIPTGCSHLWTIDKALGSNVCPVPIRIHWLFEDAIPSFGCPHWHLIEIKVLEIAQNSLIYKVSHLSVSCTLGMTAE